MEPVLGVAVVRLAPMHDRVQETALGVVDVLRYSVRLVQMIVPEQGCGANQRLEPRRELCGLNETVELAVQFHQGQPARAWRWPQAGQFRRRDQALEGVPGRIPVLHIQSTWF